MNTPKICLVCGKEFADSKHPNRKYCSHACAMEDRKHQVTLTCLECGKAFAVQAAKAERRFCSQTCSNRYNQKPDPSKRAVFTCVACGKQFEGWVYRNPSCCSRKCASGLSTGKPKPTARRPQSIVNLTCETCGKPYSVHKSQITGRRSRFCSPECRDVWTSEARKGAGNVNYRGGTVRYRGANWERQQRAALKRDGYKCQICSKRLGKQGWDYGVHHIKPYREFNGDYLKANELTNLITLCRRCHGRVEAGKIACPRPLF